MIKLKEVGFPTFIKKISLPLFQERDLIILYATCRPSDTIYLFELRNEPIIVNIFVNVMYINLTIFIIICSFYIKVKIRLPKLLQISGYTLH